jgi:hypothetical protein
MSIQDYINTNVQLYNRRSGMDDNPISLFFVENDRIYRQIVSFEEPSCVGVPFNVLWICTNASSNFNNTVQIRTSLDSDAPNGTRNTWALVTDLSVVYSVPQIYNLTNSSLMGELLPGDALIPASVPKKGIAYSTTSQSIAIGTNDPRMTDTRMPVTSYVPPLLPASQLITNAGITGAIGVAVATDIALGTAPEIGMSLVISRDGATSEAIWRFITAADIALPNLTSLAIAGPTAILETSTTSTYTAEATFSDSSTASVSPAWTTSDQTIATIDASGVLTVLDIRATSALSIEATYRVRGITKHCTYPISIGYVQALRSISILGSASLTGLATSTYTLEALWHDTTTTAISAASWEVVSASNSAVAAIDASGVLTISALPGDSILIISATYDDAISSTTVSTTRTISVAAVQPVSIAVTGPTSVYARATATYVVTATYPDASTADITSQAVLSASSGSGSFVNALYTAANVATDTNATITASYIKGALTLLSNLSIVAKAVIPVTLAVTSSTQSVSSGTGATCQATATYNNGNVVVVSSSTVFTATHGTFSGANFTASLVTVDTPTTITGTYTEGSHTIQGTVAITEKAVTPVSLVVTGPASVFGSDSAAYVATVTYSDSSTAVVSNQATFTATVGTFSGANFTATNVTATTASTVTASFTANGITKTGTLLISLKVNALVSIAAVSPISVNAAAHATIAATALSADGRTIDISTLATYTSPFGTFVGNVFTAAAVSANTNATILVSYTFAGVTKTSTLNFTVMYVLVGTIYYGQALSGAINSEAKIKALGNQLPTLDSGQTFSLNVTGTNFGYCAIPSVIANAGAATFTDTDTQLPSGWDGASWPGTTIGSSYGPIVVNGTGGITWYLYRHDFYAMGSITYMLTW